MNTKIKIARNIRAALSKLSGVVGAVCRVTVAVVLVGSVFFANEAKGSNPPLFPWGNSNVLLNFAVTNTLNMVVGVYGESSPGVQNSTYSGAGTLANDYSFSNMTQINQALQQVTAYAVGQAISNTSVPVNTNLPLLGTGFGVNFYNPPNRGSQCFGFHDVPIPLVYTNGNLVPDLSGIHFNLDPFLIFYVPDLEWARIEVYYATNMAMPFIVVDSRDADAMSSETNNIDIPDQAITLDTTYLASGYNGPYRLKVSLLTSGSGFQIVDSMGNLTAETPFTLTNFCLNVTTFNLTVVGGDIGRVFLIQQSPDLIHWLQVGGGPYTVNGSPQSFQESLFTTTSNAAPTIQIYYRVATTNALPQ